MELPSYLPSYYTVDYSLDGIHPWSSSDDEDQFEYLHYQPLQSIGKIQLFEPELLQLLHSDDRRKRPFPHQRFGFVRQIHYLLSITSIEKNCFNTSSR